MTTVKAKTWIATLDQYGTCTVRGLHAGLITSDFPNTTASLSKRNELRSEIRKAFSETGVAHDDLPFRWEAA